MIHMKWRKKAHRRALLCCCIVQGLMICPLREGITSAIVFRVYKQCTDNETMHNAP